MPDEADTAQTGPPGAPVAGEAGPPIFVQKLQNFKLMEGSDATFVAKIVANPMPTVINFCCSHDWCLLASLFLYLNIYIYIYVFCLVTMVCERSFTPAVQSL